MATQPKMKAIWEEIENLMILAGSDESLDPTLFTVSVAESGLIVTIPIGMDFRFCRGVSSCYGKSALSELTIELIPNWTSPSRPGRVNTSDRMCVVPCRKIQIPKDICGQIGNFNIPVFGRRRAEKVWIQRSGNLLITTDIIIERNLQTE